MVRLWVDLFDEHELLTSATAIALRALIAMVALALLAIALLGETGNRDVWKKQVATQIRPKVLPDVYLGIEATVNKIFSSSSVGLIAFATVLAIWQVSGAIRACMSALSKIYGTKDERPWYTRFPLSVGIAVVVLAALVVVAWIAQSLLFALYVKDIGNYKSAVGSLLLVYVLTTYAYVGSIVLMVGVELDELLRRDLQGEDERGILEMARDIL